jgi:membrane protein YqaA with SNARE-associated domain
LVYFVLFISCFLAATLVPFSSEALFLYDIKHYDYVLILIIATFGNWLGGLLTYWFGWLAKWDWIEKYFRVKKSRVEEFKLVVQKYGAWMGWLCWLPIIGDIIAIGLGVFRVSPTITFITMFLGKMSRYVAIGYLMDLIF